MGGPRPPASCRRETAKALTSADDLATIEQLDRLGIAFAKLACGGYIDS
jgi:hypothetical protein